MRHGGLHGLIVAQIKIYVNINQSLFKIVLNNYKLHKEQVKKNMYIIFMLWVEFENG